MRKRIFYPSCNEAVDKPFFNLFCRKKCDKKRLMSRFFLVFLFFLVKHIKE